MELSAQQVQEVVQQLIDGGFPHVEQQPDPIKYGLTEPFDFAGTGPKGTCVIVCGYHREDLRKQTEKLRQEVHAQKYYIGFPRFDRPDHIAPPLLNTVAPVDAIDALAQAKQTTDRVERYHLTKQALCSAMQKVCNQLTAYELSAFPEQDVTTFTTMDAVAVLEQLGYLFHEHSQPAEVALDYHGPGVPEYTPIDSFETPVEDLQQYPVTYMLQQATEHLISQYE